MMADMDSGSQAASEAASMSSDSLASSAMSSAGNGGKVDVVTELFKLVGQLMGVFSGSDQPAGTSSRQAADSFVSSVAGVSASPVAPEVEASADVGRDVSLSPLAAGGQVSSPVSVSVSGPEL